jgi:photosystem II stability/assembly factor-like uncharacterized protein
VIDPFRPSTVFVATGSGIVRGDDNGARWQPAVMGLPDETILRTLAADPSRPGVLLAGLVRFGALNGRLVYASSDRGESWQPLAALPGGALAVTAITTGFPQPTSIYAAVIKDIDDDFEPLPGPTLYRSDNGGQTWAPAGEGLPEGTTALTRERASGRLYAGSADGVYRSQDAGATFQLRRSGLVATVLYALAADPARTGHLYAGTESSYYESRDGGDSWHAGGLPDGVSVSALAIDPTRPDTVYAATYDNGIFKSRNAGRTWRPVNLGLADTFFHLAITVDPIRPQILYTATDVGVYRSDDGGERWRPANRGLGDAFISTLSVDPKRPHVVYAGGDRGIFKTTTSGAHWKRANAGIANNSWIFTITIDPTNRNRLYAGSVAIGLGSTRTAGGLYLSQDAGRSWQAITNGLPDNVDINAILANPARSATLYAATDHGVYTSRDRGNSWTAMNDDLTPLDIFCLAITPDGRTLYAGSNGGGVTRTTITP